MSADPASAPAAVPAPPVPTPPVARPSPVPLTARVTLRLTQAERVRLQEEAARAGLSVSELVRRRAFGRKVTEIPDLARVRELRRLGVSLRQLPPDGAGGEAAISDLLAKLGAAIDRVAQK